MGQGNEGDEEGRDGDGVGRGGEGGWRGVGFYDEYFTPCHLIHRESWNVLAALLALVRVCTHGGDGGAAGRRVEGSGAEEYGREGEGMGRGGRDIQYNSMEFTT